METQSTYSVQILADTQLINDWQNVSPFKSNGQIATVQGPDGSVQAFTIGTDGNIYNIWQDSTSPTGWSCLNINFPDTANPAIAVGQDLDNNIVIIAASSQGFYYEYWYCKNQNWGQGWSSVNSTSLSGNGSGYNYIQSIQLYRGNEGLFCLTNGYCFISFLETVYNAGFISSGVNPAASPNWPTLTSPGLYLPPSSYPYGNNFFIGSPNSGGAYIPATQVYEFSMGILNGTGEGIFVSQPDPNNANNSIIYFYPMFGSEPGTVPGSPLTILASNSYSLLSTTINAQGYSEIFLIHNPDNSLNYVSQANNSYSLVNLSAGVSNITFTCINPSTNTAGELEVFALGSDNNLYHTYLDSSSGQWTSLTPVMAAVSGFSVSKNSENYSEVFAITTANLLYNVWQDSDPDSGLGWQTEQIELPVSNPAQPTLVSTYSTLISVTDATTNKPLAQEPLTVYASDLLEIQVNGTYIDIDADKGASCQTDSTGKLVINYTAGGLNTPTLKITAGFLDPENDLFIDPSANAQATIGNMTVAELQTAATPDLPGVQQTSLLSSAYQTTSAATDVQSSFQQLLNFQPASLNNLNKTAKFLNRGKAKHGIYLGKADLKTIKCIDPDSVNDQCWSITFSNGFKFEKLDKATAAQRADGIKSEAISSLFDSWDDLWAGIQNAVIQLSDWVCQGVQSTITYIIDGIKYYYDQAIETVDQAINALEGLFELFGATISNWLTYLGNLLDWDDIMNTSQNLQPLVLQPLTTIQGLLNQGNISVNSYFANQRQNITDFFTSINNYFDSSVTIGSVQAYNNQTIPPPNFSKFRGPQASDSVLSYIQYFDPSVTSNWLMNKVWENLGGQSGSSFNFIPANLIPSINSFLEAVENSQVGQDVQNLITQISDFYTNITSSPDNWEQLTIAAALGILEQLILLVLDTVDALASLLIQLANDIISALIQALTMEINIPVVSWFYETFISDGQPLTIAGLFSLLIAVPTTIAYKLANNNTPPFPSNSENKLVDKNSVNTSQFANELITWITSGSLAVFLVHDLWTEVLATDTWMAGKQSNNLKIDYNSPLSLLSWYLVGGTTVPALLPLALKTPNFSSSASFDIASSVLWCIRLAPSLTNYINFFATGKGAKTSVPGIAVLTVTGLASLAAGITKSCYAKNSSNPKDNTVPQYLRDTIPSIPLILKFLFPFVKPTPPGIIAGGTLLAATAFSDEANVFLPLILYYDSQS